jgi:hypothetical protein
MKRKQNTKAENLAQVEAFRRMKGDKLALISQYAADFRKIITDFECTHEGRAPSADDLIWIESEHEGHDITKEWPNGFG